MNLMYITNNIKEAIFAEKSGVKIIFIDLERIGKLERQDHLDTFISSHTIGDISKLSKVLKKSKILVRVNPLGDYSKKEINDVISQGADIVMLPMFTNRNEVAKFIDYVGGRAKTCLLLETAQALSRCDDILTVDGIDIIYVGLNDLHLSLKLTFMFEPLAYGLVEYLSKKILNRKIEFGFGGIAKLGGGVLSSELVLSEHVRLKSNYVILSREFRNGMLNEGEDCFVKEIQKINELYNKLCKHSEKRLLINKQNLIERVSEIVYEKSI